MIKKILIIKHGAFGDIIKAVPTLNSLHHHFKNAGISLLTSPKFITLHQLFFKYDVVFTDNRNRNIFQNFKLLRKLKQQNFDLIIDLQNSKRTNCYYYILKYVFNSMAVWSGTARNCHYHIPYQSKKNMHTVDRFNQQLNLLHVTQLPYGCESRPIFQDFELSQLPEKFALLIPGCSAASPEKRWSIDHYIHLSQSLKNLGIASVFIGGPEEDQISHIIAKKCPWAINLINTLNLHDILSIAQKSQVIIGNDTGPLYLAQLSGQPTCVLWSGHSNPTLHGPRGQNVHILQSDSIDDISVSQVMMTIQPHLQ